MRILVIGGTSFLGRHLVEAALMAGHDVTLFTRGKTNPDLFPAVTRLRGDRRTDLSALEGGRWDVAIDTCGYVPRDVRAAMDVLRDAVAHYTYVSSISVYAAPPIGRLSEDHPVGTLDDPTTEELTDETYGPLKALCEHAAEAEMPGRALIVRPGLIVGPFDPSDRFTYWPLRMARGGEVLAPGKPDRPVQLIDARDLAAWMLRMSEQRATGIYNATSEEMPFADVLEACRAAAGTEARIEWIDDEAYLLEHKVTPWTELPVWVPEAESAFMQTPVDKAVAAGLTTRPVLQTAEDTLAWARARGDVPLRAGLAPQKERAVLEAWLGRD